MKNAQSYNSLADNKQYDQRVGFGVNWMYGRKAKMVTFYKNGDPLHSGTLVSVQQGKDFKTINNLYDYLTQRTKLTHGVRYIFTLEGEKIKDLRQLEDGMSYVVSSTKKFQSLPYGKNSRLRTAAPVRKYAPVGLTEDDIKLLKPVDPEKARVSKNTPYRGSGTHSLPGLDDSRIIRVINGKESGVQSRVLLNLRTVQPFEEVVGDLGQAVKMKDASRMMTSWKQEVRSFSQLKHELKDVDTFYLDNGSSEEWNRNSKPRRRNSAPKTNQYGTEEEVPIRDSNNHRRNLTPETYTRRKHYT